MEINESKSEAELVQSINDKKNAIRNARYQFERQWMVNLAFLYGKQHFFVSNKKAVGGLEERIMWELQSNERKEKTKRSSNYILPLYRSLLARLLRMKANINVEPTTSDDRDKSAARVSQEALEDFWQMANKNNPLLSKKYAGMLRILFKLFSSLLGTGRGYLMPYFNPNTQSKALLDGKVISGEIGEVECKVFTPFNIYEDRLGMHLIEETVLPIDIIEDTYNVKDLKADDLTLTEPEQELLNILEGNTDLAKLDKGAIVRQYWEYPSKKNPRGKHITTACNKVLDNGDIPPEYKGKIPYFEFNYLDLLMSTFPQAMVEQLISLQEDYNYTLSRIHAYKKWFAGKLKVPKKCKLETKYNDEIGQIIYYEAGFGEPHFEAPPSPPSFLMEDLLRIRKDMEDVSSVHNSNVSPSRSAGKSGVAIQGLNDLDDSDLMPVLSGIETQLGFFSETVLDIMEAKYQEPRLIAISGKNMSSDVSTFMGKDTAGNKRIKINMGSALPASRVERQQFLMMLADKGYIDRSKAMELMEFGDIAGAFVSIDENAQKQEIGELLKGVEVVPQAYDYHPTHIHQVEQYMKSDAFKKQPPEIQQLIQTHYKVHQEFMRAENATAAQMAGSQEQAQGGK